MNRTRAILLGVATAAIVAANVMPALAADPPPPIAGEFLTGRAVFVDDIDLRFKIKMGATTVVEANDPSSTVVVRYTVQPGAQFPWHTHAGPVVVNIVSGELTYIHEDCDTVTYVAGEAFVDAGHGHVHSAINETAAPTILVATFFEAPASGPLVIPADPSAC